MVDIVDSTSRIFPHLPARRQRLRTLPRGAPRIVIDVITSVVLVKANFPPVKQKPVIKIKEDQESLRKRKLKLTLAEEDLLRHLLQELQVHRLVLLLRSARVLPSRSGS